MKTMSDTMKIMDMDDYQQTFEFIDGEEKEILTKKESTYSINDGDNITIIKDGISREFKVKYVGKYKTKINLTLERL